MLVLLISAAACSFWLPGPEPFYILFVLERAYMLFWRKKVGEEQSSLS
jgi:hypothetical protein